MKPTSHPNSAAASMNIAARGQEEWNGLDSGLAAAKRRGAVVTTLTACHMVILQEPAKVATVIDEAARKAVAN